MAEGPEALLAVTREFARSLDPDQLQTLPASARPNGMHDIDELAAFNLQVARDELMFSGDAQTRSLLRAMLTVLSEATNRAAQFSLEARLLKGGAP